MNTAAIPALDSLDRVIDNDLCVGCGACAAFAPKAFAMVRTDRGAMRAKRIAEVNDDRLGRICPFSDRSRNEDAIAAEAFPATPNSDPQLGRYEALFAGWAEESTFREKGSSGGLASWIAAELLRRKWVDAIVHVHPRDADVGSDLFGYALAESAEEITRGAKSRYYSVSMDRVLQEVKERRLRVAFVGVPCFVTAVRNVAEQDNELAELIQYVIAIFCGHMKAATFGESLAWQVGVRPGEIAAEDFRRKQLGKPASDYAFEVRAKGSSDPIHREMNALIGRQWDGGYFKLKACDFCDDVVGETADIAFGDAWLPEYVEESLGFKPNQPLENWCAH